MEMCNSKGGRTAAPTCPAMLLLLMIMIMMLLDAYCCGAAVLAKSNTSFRCSDDRLDECLIEEDLELELGFLIMNPYVSRILAVGDPLVQTESRNEPSVTCGTHNDGSSYSSCISAKQKPNKHDCDPKNPYNRCNLKNP